MTEWPKSWENRWIETDLTWAIAVIVMLCGLLGFVLGFVVGRS